MPLQRWAAQARSNDEPSSWNEAIDSNDTKQWQAAAEDEMRSLEKAKVFHQCCDRALEVKLPPAVGVQDQKPCAWFDRQVQGSTGRSRLHPSSRHRLRRDVRPSRKVPVDSNDPRSGRHERPRAPSNGCQDCLPIWLPREDSLYGTSPRLRARQGHGVQAGPVTLWSQAGTSSMVPNARLEPQGARLHSHNSGPLHLRSRRTR
jgi:hypothetical protein